MRYRIFLARTPYTPCPPLPDREGLTPPFPIVLEEGEPVPAWPGLELTPVSEVEGWGAREDAMVRLEAKLQRGPSRVLEFRPRGPV